MANLQVRFEDFLIAEWQPPRLTLQAFELIVELADPFAEWWDWIAISTYSKSIPCLSRVLRHIEQCRDGVGHELAPDIPLIRTQ